MKMRHLLGLLLFFFTLNCFAVTKPISLGDDLIVLSPYIELLQGKRVAIVANMASVNSKGQHIIDVLYHNPKVNLVAIFTPEHGLRETLNQPNIKDTIDKKTGLPVYSLFGVREAPSAQQLKKVDVILFDLQSAGVRYYTFISTLALVMKSAKKYNKEVIVLDRPNPLGGKVVYGPELSKKLSGTFTAYYPIPMRYGLTIGELAKYYNKYFHINAKLRVVSMKNWHRNMFFPQTGLKWVAPSPGLRTFKQTLLYSIYGPLESLAFTVSRGDHELYFDKVYGAPWINAAQAKHLVAKINKLNLPGLKFKARTWQVKSGSTLGKMVSGFQVYVTDVNKVRGFYSLVSALKIMHQMFGNYLQLNPKNKMIGSAWVMQAIKKNMPTNKIVAYDNKINKNFVNNSKTIYLYK